jgi:dolichol-phosphate mannosyltransferase
MRHIFSPRNRKKTFEEAVKYMIVSFIGAFLNLSLLYFLTEFFGVYYLLAAAIGTLVAGVNNFTLDKIWTFKETLVKRYFIEYLHFLGFGLFTMGIHLGILYVLTEYAGIFYLYSQIIAMIIGWGVHFIFNKLYTFNGEKRKDGN